MFQLYAIVFHIYSCVLLCFTFTVAPAEIFCVARTSKDTAPPPVVVFNDIIVSTSANYDQGTSRYTVPQTGFYWFSLGVGIDAMDRMTYVLNGGQYGTDISRTSTSPTGPDTLARDVVQYLTAGTVLYMSASSATFSNERRQTMWAGVQLSSIFQEVVAFAVARDSQLLSAGTVSFNSVFVNEGNGWQNGRNEFVAPRDGIYFLSISSAVTATYSHDIRFVVNGQRQVKMWRNHVAQTGTDMLNRATLLNLVGGERVSIELVSGGVYSDSNHQTAFCGFLYDPISVSAPVAWSAHRSSSGVGVTNALSFDRTFVNEGNAWNGTHLTAPVAGFYFVNIDVAASGHLALTVTLMKGNTAIADIYRATTYHTAPDSLGRSIIVEVAKFELLYVRADTTFQSDSNLTTSISGFLLYELSI